MPDGMAGRLTILASMLGEESFIDANGNGVLDAGDPALREHTRGLSGMITRTVRSIPPTRSLWISTPMVVYDGADSDLGYNGVLCCDAAAVAAAETAVAEGEDSGVCYRCYAHHITCLQQ